MKDWKTTVIGLAVIITGGALIFTGVGTATGAALLPVGLGFIVAADSKSVNTQSNDTKNN